MFKLISFVTFAVVLCASSIRGEEESLLEAIENLKHDHSNITCDSEDIDFYWHNCRDGGLGKKFSFAQLENITLTQNENETSKDLNLSRTLAINIDLKKREGRIHLPRIDIHLSIYKKGFHDQCAHYPIWTGLHLIGLDACEFSENCHIEQRHNHLKLRLNFKRLLGRHYRAIEAGHYYGFNVEYKSFGRTVFCFFMQDFVAEV